MEKKKHANDKPTTTTRLVEDEQELPDESSNVARHTLGIICGVLAAVGLAESSICVQLLEGMKRFTFYLPRQWSS